MYSISTYIVVIVTLQRCTPVHFAASCGHGNMLDTLLQYGGSPSTPDKHGYTPIHKASNNGHDTCLEILLDVSGGRGRGLCGISSSPSPFPILSLDHQDLNKNTALHLACLQAHEECALAILEKCSDAITQMTNLERRRKE